MRFFTTKKLVAATLLMFAAAQSFAQTTFWSEDFSGGSVPATWTNVDATSAVGQEVTFVWSNDPAAVAPAALGYTPSATFNATGASNGYIWCNSDRGLAAAPAVDHTTRLTTAAIDCSAQPVVVLQMDGLIGVFDYDAATNVKVQVSTDGTTWTDFFPYPCLVTGASNPPCSRWSANPNMSEIDITSVAGGQSTVFIRFEWIGGWDYFWAIDNIKLNDAPTPGPPHSTAILEFARPNNYATPTTQIDSVFFGGIIVNNGDQDQTGVELTVTVTEVGGSTPVWTGTEVIGNFPSGDTLRVEFTTAFIPAANVTEYTYVYELSQDSTDLDPADNTATGTFEITAATGRMMRDDGIAITGYRLANTTDVEIGNFYEAINTQTAYGIYLSSVSWDDLAAAGEGVTAKLYQYTNPTFSSVGAADFIQVGESSPFLPDATLANGALVSVPIFDVNSLANGVELQPNTFYLASFVYEGTTTVFVSACDEDYSYNFNFRDQFINYLVRENANDQTWGTFSGGEGLTFIVGLDFDGTVNTEAPTVKTTVNVFPNPANETVVAEVNFLSESSKVVYNVLDINGRVLYTEAHENVTAEMFRYDVRNLANGSYILQVISDEGVATKKFNVTK